MVKEELTDSDAEKRAIAEHRDKANAEWRRSRVVASADRHEAERRARKEERRERKRLEAEHAKKLKDKQRTANDKITSALSKRSAVVGLSPEESRLSKKRSHGSVSTLVDVGKALAMATTKRSRPAIGAPPETPMLASLWPTTPPLTLRPSPPTTPPPLSLLMPPPLLIPPPPPPPKSVDEMDDDEVDKEEQALAWKGVQVINGMSAEQQEQTIEDMYAIQRAQNEEDELQVISRKMPAVLTEEERAKRKEYNDARRGTKVRGGKRKQMLKIRSSLASVGVTFKDP